LPWTRHRGPINLKTLGFEIHLIAEHNANPRHHKWTAKGEAILEKIHRAGAALDNADAALVSVSQLRVRV
jgi:hypothetical protein